MTPAERLRAAAQLARETAEAATPGPWCSMVEGRDHRGGDDIISAAEEDIYVRFGYVTAAEWTKSRIESHEATQDHIALWSPPVALKVAVLLEQVATTMEAFSGASFDVAWNYAREVEVERTILELADALLQTQPVKP